MNSNRPGARATSDRREERLLSSGATTCEKKLHDCVECPGGSHVNRYRTKKAGGMKLSAEGCTKRGAKL